MTVRAGTVYLVGAGPGDPGLITARGLELLRRADVVLHDRLVSAALMDEAPAQSLRIPVGKTPRGPQVPQDDINDALVRYAARGSVVVRLKGGDPTLFGRAWEELEFCRRAGTPCEIVPGVTSALAAPTAAGIALTRRGMSASVAFIAAHGMTRERLVASSGADTCVYLMGVESLPALTQGLIASGKPPSTPVAVVENGTLPQQRVMRASLGTVADVTREEGLQSPAVVIVGPTATLPQATPGPLSGLRLVVTRPQSAAGPLTDLLRARGAHVVLAPAFDIVLNDGADDDLRERLVTADWILFTSRHAVRGLRRIVERRGFDVRVLAGARLGAVGPGTSRELATWGLRADIVASPARADALVDACLLQHPRPRQVVHPCGSLALDTVPVRLRAAGVSVDRIEVYRSRTLAIPAPTLDAIARGVAGVTFASPSAVAAFASVSLDRGRVPAICIGPTTAAAARAAGWRRVVSARDHSDAGLADACTELLGPRVELAP